MVQALDSIAKAAVSPSWNVERIRADFPVLHQTVNGKPLVYLDNAASSQVPQVVIDRGSVYLEQEHSNIHRGVHYLSQRATTAYEGARENVKRFINARESRECIFVRGATEGINLVMYGYGRKFINPGDEIIISAMEHHANIVPWQMLCEEKGARLRVIPMNDAGELLLDEYEGLLNERTKLVGVVHVSNALGTINPSRRLLPTRTSTAYRSSSMARRLRHTCPSICRISTATFTCFRVTRCMRPPGVASFTVRRNCLKG
jgi:cysteine desulfurase/selenocysteine lyase